MDLAENRFGKTWKHFLEKKGRQDRIAETLTLKLISS